MQDPHISRQGDDLPSAADLAAAAGLREFYDRPGFLVRRAHQVVVASFIEDMGAVRLTPTQFAALVVICDQPQIDQISLARRLGIDRTNASMVVNGLVQNGWLHTARAPHDGRRNVLTATRAGEASMLLARDIAIAHGRKLAQLLPEGDLARLCDLIRKIVTTLPSSAPDWQRPDGGRDLFDLSGLADMPGHAGLYGAIGFVMRRAQQVLEATFLDTATARGMTPRRAATLYVTAALAPVEQLALARWLALDNSTTASVVGDLVAKGLLGRALHPHDKRRRILTLTPEGAAVLSAQSAGAERASALVHAALGADVAEFTRLMQRFLLASQHLNRVALHPAVIAQNRADYGD